jgi:hypothetical protein
MTTNHSTRTDAQRLQALHRRQKEQQLTPEELAECNLLERREEAHWLCEAIYGAMGHDINVERALKDVPRGLLMYQRDDAHTRVNGLKLALTTMLDEPDALIAAVRVLLRNLEADD